MTIRKKDANDELYWPEERTVIYFKVRLIPQTLTPRRNTLIKGVKSSNTWQDNNKVDIRVHYNMI